MGKYATDCEPTEDSATNAWYLNLNNGNANNNTKASNTNRVRAVSALLTEIETLYINI